MRLHKGRITDIGTTLDGPVVFDGKGGALLPSLHDHHIHLNASAAALNSVSCGPPDVHTEADLITALQSCKGTYLRGVGYHHSVAGEIDSKWLDTYGPDIPIRIQHRSGRLWILNSRAMQQAEISTPKDGRILDNDIAMRRQSQFPDLKAVTQLLHSYGITGVTEVTPSNGRAEFENYLANIKNMHLSIMGTADLSDLDHTAIGPLKLHYHDHNLPPLQSLADEMKHAHKNGRNIAIHCVTRAELMLALAALEIAGPVFGDRIEHAAIADKAALEWMQRLNVIVVTQPNFIAERYAAYIKDVPAKEHQNLWRLKSFDRYGLQMAAGSDSPFGNANPWAAMAAAVTRPKGFESERLSAEEVLSLYTKPVHQAGSAHRKLEVGAHADMCLLDKSWAAAKSALGDVKVLATWFGGDLVYNRINQAPV